MDLKPRHVRGFFVPVFGPPLPPNRAPVRGVDQLVMTPRGMARCAQPPTRRALAGRGAYVIRTGAFFVSLCIGGYGRPAVLSSLSYTTTLRSLSALMILLFSGLSPERTMLINDGVTPFFFAHFFWLPARLTSKRSKRTTSL